MMRNRATHEFARGQISAKKEVSEMGQGNNKKVVIDGELLALSPRFTTYLRSSKAVWYWSTVATALITAILIFSIPDNLYPWLYFRNALGALFVLWLPGYALSRFLFPKNLPIKASTENLDRIVRIAVSLGMSIAIVPLVGLLVNYLSFGISLLPIVLSLLAFTMIFVTAAIINDYLTFTKNEE
jgi:uncharacterized membrane protein